MITREEIIKIADLAKLKLTEEEILKYGEDLNNILDYANALNMVDTSAIKPSATSLSRVNVFREDKVQQSLSRSEVLQNANNKEYGCFKVLKVVE